MQRSWGEKEDVFEQISPNARVEEKKEENLINKGKRVIRKKDGQIEEKNSLNNFLAEKKDSYTVR